MKRRHRRRSRPAQEARVAELAAPKPGQLIDTRARGHSDSCAHSGRPPARSLAPPSAGSLFLGRERATCWLARPPISANWLAGRLLQLGRRATRCERAGGRARISTGQPARQPAARPARPPASGRQVTITMLAARVGLNEVINGQLALAIDRRASGPTAGRVGLLGVAMETRAQRVEWRGEERRQKAKQSAG